MASIKDVLDLNVPIRFLAVERSWSFGDELHNVPEFEVGLCLYCRTNFCELPVEAFRIKDQVLCCYYSSDRYGPTFWARVTCPPGSAQN